MKTLILSCNTGGGHNAAGISLANELDSIDQPSTFLDALSLSGEKYSNYVSNVYSALVNNLPQMFGAIYKISENMSDPNKGPRLCWITRSFQAKLLAYIEAGDFDVIVTTHFFVAQVLTILKVEGKLTLPIVAIVTDYTCGPFWEETTCDYYIIPHIDLIPEFVERGLPLEKLRPFGIPVNSIFNQKSNNFKGKSLLGLDPYQPMILMMSGSMGHGDISKRVRKILKHSIKFINSESAGSNCDAIAINIVIICGNNKDLKEKLSKKYKDFPNIIIKGYEKNIHLLMDACDVLLTKPGGLTSTEAAVKNVPLIHVDAIPGCETKNAVFFQERSMSIVCSSTTEEAYATLSLCYDKALCHRMKKAQSTHSNSNTAKDISTLLLEITNHS